ncbi:plasmid replication protein (plasmid) [Lichenicola cladoniae]|uniref:Plasmid replication protein n=1 Tax=Lichenicola cladoniae TaxID=1484109 RepID=A0A6M8HWF3_9PROT|nr:plasmid replication protein [Lichenicola cladoniae]NPD69844.1 plasmid replication protein [Acetobacteraceae bacterium]QKE92924.1 plasmid replication protein [Lichenicola cladoniae]
MQYQTKQDILTGNLDQESTMAAGSDSRKAVQAAQQSALQFALWEVLDTSKTNMVALYDLAPRFVFDQRRSDAQTPARKVIERDFSFDGKRYRITMKPTQIILSDKTEVERYLGEREQIVEEVIRRLASNRNRLRLHGENKIRFVFTVYEVQEELARVKHTYSRDEIREAITLLAEVRLKIESLDERRAAFLSAAAFPVMGMRRAQEDDSETFVEFNPLVADAIKMLSFEQVSYELLMKVRDPVARWLLKRLHTKISNTNEPIQLMDATEIRRDSGMPVWKKSRDMLRRVSSAVDVLRREGILTDIQTEERMVGKRKDDLTFTMVASEWFAAQTRRSRQAVVDNQKDFVQAATGRNPADDFVPLPPADAYRLRELRKRREKTLTIVGKDTLPD